MTPRTPHWTRSALRATIAIPSLRSLRGFESLNRRQKTPHLEVFFLALFEDMTHARFARFRHSRNDTADTAEMTLRTPHWTRSAQRATIAIPSLRSLPRYNPKQKGHCPPQHPPSKSPKYHNILCFFFPKISLAVSLFSNLTAKYSQSQFRAVFPRISPPFELPVSAPLLRGFYIRNLPTHNDSPIDFLAAIYSTVYVKIKATHTINGNRL